MKDTALILQKELTISEGEWQDCVRECQEKNTSLLKVLLKKGAGEEKLLRILSGVFHVPFTRLKREDIDPECVKDVSPKLATQYHFIPLKEKRGKLIIAVNDPFDIALFDEIRAILKKDITVCLALARDINDAIKAFYGVGADTVEKMVADNPLNLEVLQTEKDQDIKDETIDPSVIKFLNQLLTDAIKQRATDIHIEPFEDILRIRYRIDGVLHEVPSPETIKHFQESISSRIKVMANLDITEKRRPQDGRIKVKMGEEVYDLRISVLPTPHGESIGMRLLARNKPLIGLKQLGLDTGGLERIERAIRQPHGIILVTGPTGSGKTTTLYACLSTINSPERKIITIEDPIEYQLRGITQMQVNPKVGFTFAEALRSMLRHDPNVMMVGEVRDTETAELAVRTSLTGHLVFSTLHTNDAASSISRLLDMGIDSYLLSSSLLLIVAQRLVRVICAHCKQRHTPDKELLEQAGIADDEARIFYRGAGCELCRNTGYMGRTGIFEILEITDPLREMILQKEPAHKINEAAVLSGMKTLAFSGWQKAQDGITTIEEVLRVTKEEN